MCNKSTMEAIRGGLGLFFYYQNHLLLALDQNMKRYTICLRGWDKNEAL